MCRNFSFALDQNVSVFETTIRYLGGLLSAHTFAVKNLKNYNNHLLDLAVDLGDRLILAFDTIYGIPYGTINLISGIQADVFL